MSQILLVHSRGGAPLEHVLPVLRARGEVHLVALRNLPGSSASTVRTSCASVTELAGLGLTGVALVDRITEQARRIGADAVLTLCENAVLTVAEVAARLGLRGPGPGALRARDKRLMRRTWENAGVPIPAYRPIADLGELRSAVRELTGPLLLKSAWGAGSVGQLVVSSPTQAPSAWAAVRAALTRANAAAPLEYQRDAAHEDLLVEEIVAGSVEGWFAADERLGDYLSVEGVVLDGVYHPLCITARMPTIEPFTELGALLPCTLPESLQRLVERTAAAAVDALGLENCGTHSELKLCSDGRLAMIESAARFGGVMIVRQIEEVFGLDPIGLLVDHLLGRRVQPPPRMLTAADAHAAAASVVLLAADSSGRPWRRELCWDPASVARAGLVAEPSRIAPVEGLTVSAGSPIPRYRPTDGGRAAAGVLYLTSDDARRMVRDAYAVIDGMEAALGGGWSHDADSGSGTPARRARNAAALTRLWQEAEQNRRAELREPST